MSEEPEYFDLGKFVDAVDAIRRERDALRAELAALKAREPVAEVEFFEGQPCLIGLDPGFSLLLVGTKLYAGDA